MSEIELIKIENDWIEKGFSFGIWEDLPKQCWEDFVHDEDEIFMLVSGKVELEIEGLIMHPQQGQEIYIPAGSLHSVRNLADESCKWLYGYAKPGQKEM